jgi:hypothetical protein
MTWKQYEGGTRWRVLEDGISVEVEGEGVLRTKGEPLTMRQMREDYGPELDEAAAHFDVPVEWIMAMVTIEAVRIKGTRTYDPKSTRTEPGWVSDEETPRRVSAGLMQTLITTARSMQDRYNLFPGEHIDRRALWRPRVSIMLGTAYMRYQLDRYDDEWGQDPVILTGSYNAGRLTIDKPNRDGKLNPFMVRTYGPGRTHKFLRFMGDAVAVMREERAQEDTIHASGSMIGQIMRWLFGGRR